MPTDSRGDSLNFVRAGNATCLKSASQVSGIQPGDMVPLATNQPRMVVGAGGDLALMREVAGDSLAIRTESFDNAAWLKRDAGSGGFSPTVTADQAQAPDGGLTMDRVQLAATSATQTSTLEQLGACFTGLDAASVFIRGNASSGTTDLCVRTAAAAYSCTNCSFVSGSISRCTLPNVTAGAVGDLIIGNASAYNGGITRAAADVFLWGAQCDDTSNGMVTSYMPGTGASGGTRAVETPTLPLPLSGLTGFSMSADFTPNSYIFHAGGTAVPMAITDGTLGSTTSPSTYVWLYAATSGGRVAVDTLGVASSGAATIDLFYADLDAGSAFVGSAAFHDGAHLNEAQEGVQANPSGVPGVASVLGTPVFTQVRLGYVSSTLANGFSGIINHVCIDTDYTRCRPAPPTGTTIWLGDSTVDGTCSTPQNPPVQLSRLLGRTVVNAGVGGNTVDQCAARFESTYRHSGAHTLIWTCVVNSTAGGEAGATSAAKAEVVWGEAIDAGMRVMVTGIGPWANSSGWTSGEDTEGRNYNSKASDWILDAGQQFVSFDLLGTGSPLVLKAAFDSCGDKLHPGISGVALEAYLLFDAGVPL